MYHSFAPYEQDFREVRMAILGKGGIENKRDS